MIKIKFVYIGFDNDFLSFLDSAMTDTPMGNFVYLIKKDSSASILYSILFSILFVLLISELFDRFNNLAIRTRGKIIVLI